MPEQADTLMMINQHYLGCLAHASHPVADEAGGSAAVIDPQREKLAPLPDGQRRCSYALQPMSRERFAEIVTTHQPPASSISRSCPSLIVPRS